MNFGAPLMWWSLLALLVPLAIHLLNRREGVVIRVGSIRDLVKADSRRMRRLKLEEWPLWLLRSALVATLAALLAQPLLQRDGAPADWALVAPELLDPALLDQIRDDLSREREQGAALRLLLPDFPPLNLDNPPAATTLAPALIASLASEAGKRAPGARWYALDRHDVPDVAANLVLKPVQDTRTNTFITAAVRTDDGPRVHVMTSDATGTRLTPDAAWTLDGDTLRLEGDAFPDDDTLTLSDLRMQIRIRHDADRTDDARYLEAALTVASNRIGALDIQREPTGADNLDDVHLLFWLSAEPPPQNAPRLIQDAGAARYEEITAHIAIPDTPREQRPALLRRVPLTGTPVWIDDTGASVLVAHSATHYQLATRLDPAWTDLMFRPTFLHWIFSQVVAHHPGITSSETPQSDRRRRSTPIQITAADTKTAGLEPTDQSHWLWLLAAVFFLADRYFSERRAP